MRKTVIKAKIHVIRQLIKQIKSIKTKKGSKDEAKNQRKSDRLHAEVNIIKHLKKDQISKFALTNTQSFLPEINPQKSESEVKELMTKRALIRISNCNVLKKDIEKF